MIFECSILKCIIHIFLATTGVLGYKKIYEQQQYITIKLKV